MLKSTSILFCDPSIRESPKVKSITFQELCRLTVFVFQGFQPPSADAEVVLATNLTSRPKPSDRVRRTFLILQVFFVYSE